MQFSVQSAHPETLSTDCLVLGVYESDSLSPTANRLDQAGNGWLTALRDSGDLPGKSGQHLLLVQTPDLPCQRVLLIGCGKADELDDRRFKKVLAHMTRTLGQSNVTTAVVCLDDLAVKGRDAAWKVRLAIESFADTGYRFSRFKSSPEPSTRTLGQVIFQTDESQQSAVETAIQEGQAVASGVTLARELGNLPGNVCTPRYLAEQAEELASQYPSLQVEILDQDAMQQLGMGSLLSVAKGSIEPPRLIVLKHLQGPENQAPAVLVGKGVTFDTGGISLKPGAEMDEMKFDMCGAASVLGTLKACAELKLAANVIGVIPTVENMPSDRASKPGDIVTSLSGQTIEILNTDAEGRLVLADALHWTQQEFQPSRVVDFATLTGAIIISLGNEYAGLFSNNDQLSKELAEAGEAVGDKVWRMPLGKAYDKLIDSPIADMKNIGGKGAGSITAAQFLQRFIADDTPWAHIDIAGMAWSDKPGRTWGKGATGYGVRLIDRLVSDTSEG